MWCFFVSDGVDIGFETGHGGYIFGIGRNYIRMVSEEIYEDKCNWSDFEIIFAIVVTVMRGRKRENFLCCVLYR